MMKFSGLFFLAISVVFSSYAQAKNLIESVHCTKNSITITLNNTLKEQGYVVEDFFVEYNDPEVDCTRLDYSIVTMPAVMNLVSLIWATGDIYYIDVMDEELYYSLQTVKEVFRRLYPNTSWNGELRPHSLVHNRSSFLVPKKSKKHIATFFSHGLDSICTSLKHRNKKQLLLTAWGHSDCPLGYDEVWQYLHDLVSSYAKNYNHTPLFFSSNYHRFLDFKYIHSVMSDELVSWRLGAVEGLCWIGLAAPILLSKGYTKLYIASSGCWDNRFPGAAIPMVDENISFAGIKVIHDAFDMAREEKTEYIVKKCKSLHIPHITLRVCAMIGRAQGRNCSRCEKCIRTLTPLVLLNEDITKFDFDTTAQEVIERVQEFLPQVHLSERGSFFWRRLQKFAQKKLATLSHERKAFAQWLINFDIDAITTFRPIKKIDWNDYVDLYDKIPKQALKQ